MSQARLYFMAVLECLKCIILGIVFCQLQFEIYLYSLLCYF